MFKETGNGNRLCIKKLKVRVVFVQFKFVNRKETFSGRFPSSLTLTEVLDALARISPQFMRFHAVISSISSGKTQMTMYVFN